MADLVVDNLVKTFGEVRAVDRVSLTIPAGQLTTLLGPSGCGKTTILNCIAGLELPDAGLIRIGELVVNDGPRALPPERRELGMVFQSYALWPHMTVRENLAFGLRLRRVTGEAARKRIDDALALVGLSGLGERYPFQLSGGQQQRVALARAVVVEPRVLLLDEPLSNLDAKVREQARFWLRELQQRLAITTVYVTHDQAEALAISDMVAVMSSGKLLQYAPPKEIYERPASRFVADFIGTTSFLPATVVECAPHELRARLPSGPVLRAATDADWKVGDAVVLAIRAERIEFDGGENAVPARVRSAVYLGTTYQYLVETADAELRIDAPLEVPPGEVTVRLPPEAIVVLAADG
ncbi:MAG TPA: ABC transporter ATP-binding protein [Chloroflexota bacterium]|jgi:iron(III) transport system ATP-binding protein